MNNFISTILTIISIISDLCELSYDMGVAVRRYIVPAIIMAYVVAEHYTKKAYDKMISLEMDIEMSTPALGFG